MEEDFISVNISEKFDCILVYSVLMYVESFEKKIEFILKAVDILVFLILPSLY